MKTTAIKTISKYKITSVMIILVLVFFVSKMTAHATSTPFVEDNAHVMSQSLIERVESINDAFKELPTSPELMIITLNELPENETINDYATRRFEELKIGSQEYDSGVMYILAVNNRQSRIEVGYGLEDVIPDAYTNVITDDNVKASFSEGDYEGGLNRVITLIESMINTGTTNAPKEKKPGIKQTLHNLFISIPWPTLFLIGFVIISRKKGKDDDDDSHHPSGGSGGLFGGFGSFGGIGGSSNNDSNNWGGGSGGSSGGGGGNSNW